VGARAFDTLRSATDDQGIGAAVSALAATMDGEVADAFKTFAENAITTLETTVGAIDLTYTFLAEKCKVAIQDALASLQPVINDIQGRVDVQSEFEGSGNQEKLDAELERQRQLEAQRDDAKAIMDANENGGDSDAFFDAHDSYTAALDELAFVYAEVCRLQDDLTNCSSSNRLG